MCPMHESQFQINQQIKRFLLILLFFFATLFSIPVYAQWEAVPIAPQYQLRKLFFIGDHGWMAAEETWRTGILLYTDDGGDNWREVERFAGAINDFHFISTKEGWLTAGGKLLHTQDSGETWADLSSEINAEGVPSKPGVPIKIHFFDPTNGVGVFEGRHALGDADVMVATTQDGGRHWQPRHQKQFVSRVFSWAVVGDHVWLPLYSEMWFSPNRGESWEVLAIPPGLGTRWIYFLDHKLGWSTVNTTPAQCFHTTDGGRSWQLISIIPIHGETSGPILVSARKGWLLAFPFPEDRRHHAVLLQTEDGGVKWKQAPLPVDSRTRDTHPLGLPGPVSHFAFNPIRGDLWITLYDFSHPLLRGKKAHVVSANPWGKLSTTWGKIKEENKR